MRPEDPSDTKQRCVAPLLSHKSVNECTLDYMEMGRLERVCDRASDIHKIECRYAFQLHCQNELGKSGFGPNQF